MIQSRASEPRYSPDPRCRRPTSLVDSSTKTSTSAGGTLRQRGLIPLRCDESAELRQGVKNADGGGGGKIGGEDSRSADWVARTRCFRQRSAQHILLGTGPIKAVMKQGHGRMQFGEHPLILASLNSRSGRGRKLKIGRWISVFIEGRKVEISPNEPTISRGQFALGQGGAFT